MEVKCHQMGATLAMIVILATLIGPTVAGQTVHHYEWEVAYTKMSPDCNDGVPKDVLGVRQTLPAAISLAAFPGPTIRARAGDRVEVKVTNLISKFNPFGKPERVSIHWHGIRQKGSPWNDGAAGLTQCGIPQNSSYLYNFTVDRPGTYFWHGHYNAQRAAGLYGLLIVDHRLGALTPTYDGEFAITVNDWWHSDIYAQMHGLDDYNNWTWVGAPNSFFIKGDPTVPCQKYSCPSAELECTTRKLRPLTGSGTLIWNVQPGKTYLVRLASVTSSAFLNFVIEGHVMTVLEADGHMVQPFNTTSIDVVSGQTYVFNFTTKAEYPQQRVYHFGVNARDWIADSKGGGGTDPGLAVLSYNMPYINKTVVPSPTNVSMLWEDEPAIVRGGPRFNDTEFGYRFAGRVRALMGYSYPVPKQGNVEVSFVISQVRVINDESKFVKRWAMNNISYSRDENPSPLLARLRRNEVEQPLEKRNASYFRDQDIYASRTLYRTSEVMGERYYLLSRGDVVTLVLQNAAVDNSTRSEAHPWHLHGHDFWVLGYGKGVYDPDRSAQGFNVEDPPVRNTVALFPHSWVAIRFIADNPGVWSFHRHNEWHAYLGMKVVFAYGIEDVPPPSPAEEGALSC